MTKYIPYIITFVLGFILAYFILGNKTIPDKVESTSDTIYISKIDTFRVHEPKYITKTIIDTFKIVVNEKDTVYLPKEQKYYSKANVYDVWVSGYEPNLDSINVYTKTEYQTITNTITNTKYIQKVSLYGSIGVSKYDGKIVPTFDLTLNTKGNISFGGSVGLIGNKPLYGLKIGYKLK